MKGLHLRHNNRRHTVAYSGFSQSDVCSIGRIDQAVEQTASAFHLTDGNESAQHAAQVKRRSGEILQASTVLQSVACVGERHGARRLELGLLGLEHAVELGGEHDVALDLELARHEGLLAVDLAVGEVDEVSSERLMVTSALPLPCPRKPRRSVGWRYKREVRKVSYVNKKGVGQLPSILLLTTASILLSLPGNCSLCHAPTGKRRRESSAVVAARRRWM